MNQITRIEKIISLKTEIVRLHSINCASLAKPLEDELAAIPELEEITA